MPETTSIPRMFASTLRGTFYMSKLTGLAGGLVRETVLFEYDLRHR